MQRALIRFVSDELLEGSQEIRPGQNLLADSLGMVRLVGFVEEAFGIRVPPVDFTIENFRSVDTLTAYLARRRHEGADGR